MQCAAVNDCEIAVVVMGCLHPMRECSVKIDPWWFSRCFLRRMFILHCFCVVSALDDVLAFG